MVDIYYECYCHPFCSSFLFGSSSHQPFLFILLQLKDASDQELQHLLLLVQELVDIFHLENNYLDLALVGSHDFSHSK